MKIVKARQLSAFELAKVVSKPMLVIPQPILHTHECLTNVRMTRVEPNAYVALGIKEEPIDEEECERDSNNVDLWNEESNYEDSCSESKEYRVRTRQQIKQLELVKKRASLEDANNNSNQKEEAPAVTPHMLTNSNKKVLTISNQSSNKDCMKGKVSSLSIQPFAAFLDDVDISVASNNNLDPVLNKEPPVGASALRNPSEINSKDDHSILSEYPNVQDDQQLSQEPSTNLDDDSNMEKLRDTVLTSKQKEAAEIALDKDIQNSLNDQPTIEDDFEFEDKMSSSSEDIDDIFRKQYFLSFPEYPLRPQTL